MQWKQNRSDVPSRNLARAPDKASIGNTRNIEVLPLPMRWLSGALAEPRPERIYFSLFISFYVYVNGSKVMVQKMDFQVRLGFEVRPFKRQGNRV